LPSSTLRIPTTLTCSQSRRGSSDGQPSSEYRNQFG
jgi:hypothetical protein